MNVPTCKGLKATNINYKSLDNMEYFLPVLFRKVLIHTLEEVTSPFCHGEVLTLLLISFFISSMLSPSRAAQSDVKTDLNKSLMVPKSLSSLSNIFLYSLNND